MQTAALDRAGDGAERGKLPDPAQGDGRAGLDVSDVGLDRLTNLRLPVGGRVDRCGDLVAEPFDVRLQELQKAFLLAGELVVERALGGVGVADDVGDRAGAVAALGDGQGEPVEQAEAKRVVVDSRLAGGHR